MTSNPYHDIRQRSLFEIWNLALSHKQRGLYNPPKFSGVNEQALIAYQRGYSAG